MRLTLPISLASLVMLAACSGGGPSGEADLGDTCQLQPCVCVKDGSTIFTRETVELLWQPDGRAYCPEGHHLEVEGPE